MQSEEDKIQIEKVLSKISILIGHLNDGPKMNLFKQILSEIKKLEDFKLTIEQAENLHELISQLKKENLNLYNTETNTGKIFKQIIKQDCNLLASTISSQIPSINDLEQLNNFSKIFTFKFIETNPTLLGSVKMVLDNRIRAVQNQLSSEQSRNQKSPNIVKAAKSLEKEQFNYEDIHNLLLSETQELSKSRPKSKFALTDEQLYKQVLIKVKDEIDNNPTNYTFSNPESAIENLIQLQGGKTPELAVRTIIMNLAQNSKFDTALNLCNKYMHKQSGDVAFYSYYKSLRKEVLGCEVSSMVLNHLNSETSLKEDEQFLEDLNKRLEKNKIKSTSVILGTNPSTSKKISLSDINGDFAKGQSK